MNVASDTYPQASADGTYDYRKTVSLKAMTATFAKAFGKSNLALERRAVFVHGVAEPPIAWSSRIASAWTVERQHSSPIMLSSSQLSY